MSALSLNNGGRVTLVGITDPLQTVLWECETVFSHSSAPFRPSFPGRQPSEKLCATQASSKKDVQTGIKDDSTARSAPPHTTNTKRSHPPSFIMLLSLSLIVAIPPFPPPSSFTHSLTTNNDLINIPSHIGGSSNICTSCHAEQSDLLSLALRRCQFD
jgi:hypothetical protein